MADFLLLHTSMPQSDFILGNFFPSRLQKVVSCLLPTRRQFLDLHLSRHHMVSPSSFSRYSPDVRDINFSPTRFRNNSQPLGTPTQSSCSIGQSCPRGLFFWRNNDLSFTAIIYLFPCQPTKRSRQQTNSKTLHQYHIMSALALPPELCMLVETHLSNRDIKSLRLVCKDYCTKYRLRLQRVFLSANPLNVHVFRSIAEHETFRHSVHEIIWDDARLRDDRRREEVYNTKPSFDPGVFSDSELSDSDSEEEETKDAERIPKWYEVLCHKSASTEQRPRNHKSDYKSERPEYEARMQQASKQVPTVESWKHYQQLLRQQEEVISTGADADALRYGLSRFPALRRLAITPAAHGSLFAPLYETPMIRAFPEGFMYPVSCAWPGLDDSRGYETMLPWDDDEREKWRGVCIVLREFAQ